MKKAISLALSTLLIFSLAGCGQSEEAVTLVEESKVVEESAVVEPEGKPYIAVISKGFQHQFWQVVQKGANQAAEDFGVEITFDGPPTESDINIQVDMLKSAMIKEPAAIALAALDTNAVMEQLNEAMSKGVPIVGFDSGVPNAPEGSIYATASTDNYAAAELAAEELFKSERFQAKIKAGDQITIGVLSQDATADSIIQRTAGFIDKLQELLEGTKQYAGAVEVKGHTTYEEEATAGTAKATILVNIPATTATADMKIGAEAILAADNLVALYGSNENAAGGMLNASNDGQDFSPEGKYKEIIALGFDAGKSQKNAVNEQWFLGSITQDPYQIGYKAVELAVQAIEGKEAEAPVIDTGAKWYTSENLSDPSIDELVYE